MNGKLVTKHAYPKGGSRPEEVELLDSAEQLSDEERPFAEVRKTIHDGLRLLFVHRWAFFAPFCVVSCVAFISSLHYPRTYSATTSFERRNDPVMMNLPMSAGAASFKYFRNTMVRDLTSVECMSEVVENLGLIKGPHSTERQVAAATRRRTALARSLAGTLSISTISPSEQIDIIRITYTGPDPNIGKRLVDEVKRTYIRRTMAWVHEFLTSQRDYFKREAEEAFAEVKAAERKRTHLQVEYPHIDPSNPGAVTLKLTQLEMGRGERLLRQREYEAELSALQQSLAASESLAVMEPPSAIPGHRPVWQEKINLAALDRNAQIREVDNEIEELKTIRGMRDLHPDIQQLLARRRWLAGQLEKQIRSGAVLVRGRFDPVGPNEPRREAALSIGRSMAASERTRLLAQIAAQESKLKEIEISLATGEQAMDQLRKAKREVFGMQEEFATVTGEVTQAKQKYRQLEATLANIEPAIKAVEQDRLLQFSGGEPARGSSSPISPKSSTVILLALLAGLGTGVVFVVLSEIFDHTYRSASRVARSLGLPMLESIDEIITAQDRRSLFLRRAFLTPLVVACFIGLTTFTGSMAYLSLERPWLYERIRGLPQEAMQLFTSAGHSPDVG